MTTKNPRTGATTNDSPASDLATSSAIALDDTTRWLMERVPDRVPPGAHPLALAHPSWASAAAAELARRLRSELGDAPAKGFARLAPLIDELPRALLQFNPSASELAKLRRDIDGTVEALRNPRRPAPLPSQWIEQACWLGVTLPVANHYSEERDVLMKATELIQGVYASRSDPRFHRLWQAFRKEALADGPRSIGCRRAAHALAAIKALPSIDPTGPFAATNEELRAVSAIAAQDPPSAHVARLNSSEEPASVYLSGRSPHLPAWYEPFVRSLGLQVARFSRRNWHSEIQAELAPLREEYRKGGFRTAADRAWERDNEYGYRAAIDAVLQSGATIKAVRKEMADVYGAIEEQRARIVEALRSTLGRTEIGPAWWYLRELHEGVATLSPSLTNDVLEALPRFNLRLDLA